MNQDKFVKIKVFKLIKLDQVSIENSDYKEFFIKQFSDLFMSKSLLELLEVKDVKELKGIIYKISRKYIRQRPIDGRITGIEIAIASIFEEIKMIDYIVEVNRVPGKDDIIISLLILKDKIS